MIGMGKRIGLALVLAALAPPVLGQTYSDSVRFLSAVRSREAATVMQLTAMPESVVINTRERTTGEGALHYVVRDRDLTWLALLLGKGARPDLQSNAGATPLSLAAQIGWVEGAEYLLARKASVDLPNSRGQTPLILATQRRDLAMVRLLLSKGADPRRTDNEKGMSAIDHARGDPEAAAVLKALTASR